jgi:hypothetical protein
MDIVHVRDLSRESGWARRRSTTSSGRRPSRGQPRSTRRKVNGAWQQGQAGYLGCPRPPRWSRSRRRRTGRRPSSGPLSGVPELTPLLHSTSRLQTVPACARVHPRPTPTGAASPRHAISIQVLTRRSTRPSARRCVPAADSCAGTTNPRPRRGRGGSPGTALGPLCPTGGYVARCVTVSLKQRGDYGGVGIAIHSGPPAKAAHQMHGS